MEGLQGELHHIFTAFFWGGMVGLGKGAYPEGIRDQQYYHYYLMPRYEPTSFSHIKPTVTSRTCTTTSLPNRSYYSFPLLYCNDAR
ncbi:hypothetical protein VTJ04DRAFT_8295 [Mycothermus thermophilus]|uniref:uncharacterized protein n=1 Tax=Humicola insolens TaxID=85995 RepID=UPI003742547A